METINTSDADNLIINTKKHLKTLNSIQKQAETHFCVDQIQASIDSEVLRMVNFCREFEKHFLEESGNDRKSIAQLNQLKQNFREKLYGIYCSSFFCERAFKKPLGPGDYLTIEGIYNNKPLSKDLGFYMDRCFLNQPLAKAIRNRKDWIRDQINHVIQNQAESSHKPFRILDVASGSSREWFELLPVINMAGIEVVCIDHSEDSLNFSMKRLNGYQNSSNIRFIKFDVTNFGRRGRETAVDSLGKFDWIYSTGLDDYLNDGLLSRIIKGQFEILNANGFMTRAFKDSDRYDKTVYDWLEDWHFIPRNHDDIHKLYEGCLPMNNCEINFYRDESGIIIFTNIQKL